MTQIRQIVEVPAEEFQQLKETGQKILRALENLNIVAPTEYVTIGEFMTATKMSRWKVAALRDCGRLLVIQRGRKLYIPRTQINAYFSGSMEDPA